MATLEASLTALEASVAEAQKSAETLAKALQGLRKAAGSGQLIEIEKSTAAVLQRAQEANQTASRIPAAWTIDSSAHLEREYVMELLKEAQSQGLPLVERDGRLYCFPQIIQVDAREKVVRIGKKREQRLRPKEFVRNLATMLKTRPRFNMQKFLDALHQVYRRVHRDDWQRIERGPGPAMPLADIHEIMTLFPGADYPIEEYGRDLLLLARQPDLRTREGHSFQLD
jgi:hypothetical protein